MNLEDVHLYGLRSAQPAFATTAKGILYFVTDEGVVEINSGAAWVAYSAAAAAAINQLTGDVTAGPGSGSQVATIGALKVITGMIAAGAVTEAKQTLADNTTNDVSISAHGYAPKAPNDVTKFLNGLGAYSVPAGGGGSDWTTTLVKSGNQDVLNSNVLVNATDLTIAVLANEVWMFEAFAVYSGDSVAADFKVAFAVSAGLMNANTLWLGFNVSDAAANNLGSALAAAVTSSVALGVSASVGTARIARGQCITTFSANGNFTLQFAQQTASPGNNARMWAGSILRGKKII